jgi:restriction system protein
LKTKNVPSFDSFFNSILQALKELGGSASVDELDSKVVDLMKLTETQQQVLHDPNKGGRTEIEYQLAWARTYLKKYGVIENSARSVWAFSPTGRTVDNVDAREVKRYVRENRKEIIVTEDEDGIEDAIPSWRDEVLDCLLAMHPQTFERLTQRMLREAGFIQVEVTGRSGDGGIDGKGIVRFGGFLNFRFLFQCKRYSGTVGSSQIRDFRGAIIGRADRGLFITTGSFSKDAISESNRDGAPPIDLIDGEQLIDKLRELNLGIRTELVEQVVVDKSWFESI